MKTVAHNIIYSLMWFTLAALIYVLAKIITNL